MLSILRDKKEDAEILADDLDELCADHRTVLVLTGIRKEIEDLTAWAGDYNEVERGLRYNSPVPDKVIRLGGSWLTEYRDALRARADEETRWESEGGLIPPLLLVGGQTDADDYLTAAEQLSHIARRVEKLFGNLMSAADLSPEV